RMSCFFVSRVHSSIMAIAGDAISENIALLSLFGRALGPATNNDLPPRDLSRDRNYPIPIIKHEIELAESFALILVNNVDPTRVGAVCIEATREGKLVLRTAVNSG